MLALRRGNHAGRCDLSVVRQGAAAAAGGDAHRQVRAPGFFARASAQERRFSLEQTTLLNDAYKTLKDPVRRAEHLLSLRGLRGDPKMSPGFLEETLDDRERLAEAKLSGSGVEALARGVRQKRDATLAQVRELVQRGGDLSQAAELLARMRYYARYLDEVEGRGAEI